MKEIQVTLYDIFGYLVPGIIVLFATLLTFCAVFTPDETFTVYTVFHWSTVILLLVAAYVLGHLSQAVGDYFEKLPGVKAALAGRLPLSEPLRASLLGALARRFPDLLKDRDLTSTEIFELCDQTLVHHASLGDREIFTYREGFYRGTCVALVLFATAHFASAVHAPAIFLIEDQTFIFERNGVILIGVLSLAAAGLFFRRYQRFGQYRIRLCLLRFLALSTAPQSEVK